MMKYLRNGFVWCVTFLVVSFTSFFFLGQLGAIGVCIMMALIGLIASSICKSLNEADKKKLERKRAASGLSPFEYEKAKLSKDVLNYCETHANNPALIENYISQLVNNHVVDEDQAEILLEGYLKQSNPQ